MKTFFLMTIAIHIAAVQAAVANGLSDCFTIRTSVSLGPNDCCPPGQASGTLSSQHDVKCYDRFENGWVGRMENYAEIRNTGTDLAERYQWDREVNAFHWYTSLTASTVPNQCYRARTEGRSGCTFQYGCAVGQDAGSGQSCSTPLILDLDGDGILTTSLDENPVLFDLGGEATPDVTAWTEKDSADAFLFIDLNDNQVVDGGAELFGNATILPSGERAVSGFQALGAHDTNKDGVISSSDAVWSRLSLWIDRDHDGVCASSETSSLPRWGIAWIGVGHVEMTASENFGRDAAGNLHLLKGVFAIRGPRGIRIRAMHDVYFRALVN